MVEPHYLPEPRHVTVWPAFTLRRAPLADADRSENEWWTSREAAPENILFHQLKISQCVSE